MERWHAPAIGSKSWRSHLKTVLSCPHCCSCLKNRSQAILSFIFTTKAKRPTLLRAVPSNSAFEAVKPCWRWICAAWAEHAPVRTTPTIPTVGKTHTPPISWDALASGCGLKTSSFVRAYAAERVANHRAADLSLVAVGNVGIPALHAAALEPHLFQRVAIARTLVSWANVIHSRLSQNLMASMVHGVLPYYDLPNLVAILGERLTITQPANAMGIIIQEGKRNAAPASADTTR